jgi:hypothetical protein
MSRFLLLPVFVKVFGKFLLNSFFTFQPLTAPAEAGGSDEQVGRFLDKIYFLFSFTAHAQKRGKFIFTAGGDDPAQPGQQVPGPASCGRHRQGETITTKTEFGGGNQKGQSHEKACECMT